MFKKKCLFGGGLDLGSTIAIFASISSDVIAQEFTAEARNTLTQIYWRTHAHNIIEETKWKLFKKEIKDKPWFIDKDYDESIKKVIGKAIADCLTNMNEFQDKGAEEIITFKNTNPENYDQANWNAVMLYNYVNEAAKGKITTTEERLNVCCDRIQQCYRNVNSKKVVSTEEAIKKARDDIGAYADILELFYTIRDIKLYSEDYLLHGDVSKSVPLIELVNNPPNDMKFAIKSHKKRIHYSKNFCNHVVQNLYLGLKNDDKWYLYRVEAEVYDLRDYNRAIWGYMSANSYTGKSEMEKFKFSVNLDSILEEYAGLLEVY